MDDFYINNGSQHARYNYSHTMSDHDESDNTVFIRYVVHIISICIGLPLTLVAIYALFSLVRNDYVVPIYVINLLISDLIQLCCMIVWVARHEMIYGIAIYYTYYFGVVASVGFTMCVALERYLVIACPVWYRYRRTIKASVLVCVVVWLIPSVILYIFQWVDIELSYTIFAVFLLLPLPLLIFFLGGTLRALSTSCVPSTDKRRIVGLLVLVLVFYVLLFLPTIIWFLAEENVHNSNLGHLSVTCLRLSPLADSVLYVFIRKGIIDKLLTSVCCCRMDSHDANSPSA